MIFYLVKQQYRHGTSHEERLSSLNFAPGIRVSLFKGNSQNTDHGSGSMPTLVAICHHLMLAPSVILSIFHTTRIGGFLLSRAGRVS